MVVAAHSEARRGTIIPVPGVRAPRFGELKRDLISSKMMFEPLLPTLARLKRGGLR
jgi:hypothetical protein